MLLADFVGLSNFVSPPNHQLGSAAYSNDLRWLLHVVDGHFVQGTVLDSFRDSLRPPCGLWLSSKILLLYASSVNHFLVLRYSFGWWGGSVLAHGNASDACSSFPLLSNREV